MDMIKPPPLVPGDRVALVAPASPFDRAAFEDGVAEIRALGFEPVYDARIFERDGYLAGSAATRAASVRDAWADPSVKAIMAVRGGYGSAQILPLLDPAAVRRAPKLFIGYSDTTALHTWLTCCCGVTSLHGPMVAGRLYEGAAGYDRRSLLACAAGEVPLELTAEGVDSVAPGEASGPLFGGTLTQLLASLATPFAFDPPTGCILLIDEVGERPYRLDRMLTQLIQSGLLARATGVIVNELPECDEPATGLCGRSVVRAMLADFRGPVLIGFPSGHTSGPALTLPLGVRVRVHASEMPRVVVEEPAVAAV